MDCLQDLSCSNALPWTWGEAGIDIPSCTPGPTRSENYVLVLCPFSVQMAAAPGSCDEANFEGLEMPEDDQGARKVGQIWTNKRW